MRYNDKKGNLYGEGVENTVIWSKVVFIHIVKFGKVSLHPRINCACKMYLWNQSKVIPIVWNNGTL